MSRFRKLKASIIGCALSWLTVTTAMTAEHVTNSIDGHAFFDYFYNAQTSNDAQKDVNGSRFRRIRLTYHNRPTDDIYARLRLESTASTVFESAANQRNNIGVFIKEAYVRWTVPGDWTSSLHPQFIAGIHLTPSVFQHEEAVWAYRALDQVSIDKYGYAPSVDLGVSVKGRLGESDLGYWVMVGNDSSQAEVNTKKRFYGLLHYKSDSVVAEAFGGLRTTENDQDETSAKLFAAYTSDDLTAGGTVFMRSRDNVPAGGDSVSSMGVSAFLRYMLSEKVELIARGDHHDPDTDVDDDATLMLLGGLSYKVHNNLRIIPNVVVQAPQNSNVDEDILPKITVFYIF